MKNKLKIIFLLLIGVIFSLIVLIENPILIKYFTGTARIIGKPVKSITYIDGEIDESIKIYKVNSYWEGHKANYYLLDFGNSDTTKLYNVICLNIQENYIGLPSSTNEDNYSVIFGNLFQGEVGAHFTPIDNQAKGLGFQPGLKMNENQILFNLPKEQFNLDSIRIEL